MVLEMKCISMKLEDRVTTETILYNIIVGLRNYPNNSEKWMHLQPKS